MEDARRQNSTMFADFDEFDHLLDDDEPTPAPRSRAAGSRSATAVAPQPRQKASRSFPRMGSSPDWNRIAAVGFLVAVVLFVAWFAVTSIFDARRAGSYRDYFDSTREIATQSAAQGSELESILNAADAGDRSQRIEQLEQLATRADKLEERAQGLDVPEQMIDAHRWMLASLDYRARGIEGVQRSITAAMDSKADKAKAAATVSDSLARLVASDTVWNDSFATEGRSVLSADDVSDVTVPDSTFVEDLDLVGPTAIGKTLDRLRLASKATGAGVVAVPKDGKIRGGAIEGGKVTVSPSGQTLSQTSLTEIKGGADVVFDVPFTNQGEVQLTDVPVTVTMRSDTGKPIELSGVIDVVDPGQSGTAKVALSETPDFGVPMTMDVLVGPIPGEKTTDNNRATFQVQFAL